ncbi:MAG: ABC transporter permease [Acidobacteria bacterium]|nr:ABC transporter permease [Acidobacteriota bacterium]
MKEAERILGESSLSEPVRDRVRSLLQASKLEDERAADVARELIAHFEDGLAAGRSVDELLDLFGNDDVAADLIARSKPRADRAAANPIDSGRDMPFSVLWRNLRYAVRRMGQSPGFTATAVLSLAVGIGANTAIFTLVNATILRDMPVESPDELVEIYTSVRDFQYNIFSYPNFRDVRDNATDVFESVSVSGYAFVSVDRNDGVNMLAAEAVSGQYFPLLGIRPEVGRLLGPADDIAKDAHPVAVLGHGYWQRAFGGDRGVVGELLRINGMEYEIVGVAPKSYTGNVPTFNPELFLPVMMINHLRPGLSDQLEDRGSGWLFGKARLRDGISIQQAQTRLDTIAADLKRDYPDYWQADNEFLAYASNDIVMWPPIDRIMLPAAGLFMVLVGLVLMVACANLASFLLARAMDRQKEIAIRLAMGATRRSIIGQLLTETLGLSLLGGIGGIGVSVWLLKLLFAIDLPLPIPLTVDVAPDAAVLTFSLAVSVISGLFFGVAPAWQGSGGDVAATLKEGGSGSSRPRRVSLRNTLVVAQVAFCLVLLVAAGLFVRSARATQSIDPGFGNEPAGLLTIVLPGTRYDPDQGQQFIRGLRERFMQLPGVDSVGLINNLHLTLTNTIFITFNVDGVEPPAGSNGHSGDRATVDPEFFEAAGVKILRGRNFNDGDSEDSMAVAIVSEALEQRFWPGESAVGRILRRTRSEFPDLTIVGVASDAKIRTIAEAPRSFVYLPFSQNYTPSVTFVARTATDAEATARDMLLAGRELDPELMVFETKTMERHIAGQLLPARLAAVVLTAFAVLTLALASIGLYGVVSYAVAQRTREVGIRISLGAEYGDMVKMLTAGGMKLVLVGTVIGLGLSALAAWGMGTLLYGVDAFDPLTFIAVPAVFATVAFVAAYMPARRVSRVDPVIALRMG